MGRWLIVARLWLPFTGRLPWRLRTFLEDACDCGVLRRSGPVWEFRHERLQRHLSGHSCASRAVRTARNAHEPVMPGSGRR
ncbi:hypothetical protein [Amycolatopsis sp. NPDC059657]|uniref:hypothetical protein n=1 Tax=Amycolatopsis sp. NPDC059657 TaxID=3346899 RepID=UPI00366B89E8